MRYEVVSSFKDLRDGGEYKVGDTYPHAGEADPARASQLMAPTAQRGPLIKEASEPKTEPKSATTPTKRRKKED